MKKINIADYYKLVLSITLATAIMLIGCGGGGGGSGRQTLPGENPTGPIIIPGTITNTTTQTQTQTQTQTYTNTGTGTSTWTETMTPVEMLTKGWEIMKDGNYGGSLSYFDRVLNDSRSTPEQRQQAYNGKGWAKTKYYKTIEGLDDFRSSYNLGELNTNAYRESILGYALTLIQATGDSNYDRAIDLLANKLSLSNPSYVLGIEHTWIGVSSPEAHAMLAFAYFWRNQWDLAKAQINQARLDDTSTTGTVYHIYMTLITAGLDI